VCTPYFDSFKPAAIASSHHSNPKIGTGDAEAVSLAFWPGRRAKLGEGKRCMTLRSRWLLALLLCALSVSPVFMFALQARVASTLPKVCINRLALLHCDADLLACWCISVLTPCLCA
jgi:hypothetical protein